MSEPVRPVPPGRTCSASCMASRQTLLAFETRLPVAAPAPRRATLPQAFGASIVSSYGSGPSTRPAALASSLVAAAATTIGADLTTSRRAGPTRRVGRDAESSGRLGRGTARTPGALRRRRATRCRLPRPGCAQEASGTDRDPPFGWLAGRTLPRGAGRGVAACTAALLARPAGLRAARPALGATTACRTLRSGGRPIRTRGLRRGGHAANLSAPAAAPRRSTIRSRPKTTKGPPKGPFRTEKSGGVLLSQGDDSQVPSALVGLTSVFGMGTGVTPPLWPPKPLSRGGATRHGWQPEPSRELHSEHEHRCRSKPSAD